MAKFCTKCGAPVSEGTKFCVKCGTKLMEPAAGGQGSQKAAERVSDKNKANSRKIVIIALCMVILAGIGGFFGFKFYQENNYVQAVTKVQSVLVTNQATLQKLGELKADGYPDNFKALAEEISKAKENLDKESGAFALAEVPDKYKGTAESLGNVLSAEKKLLEDVKFLLENPGDKDAAGKLADAKTAIGEVKEAAGKISIKDVDFASCTDLSPVEQQLTAYAEAVKELERKGLLHGTGQSGNDLSSYVTLKDSYDSRIAALAVEINNYTASHQNFAGATALISKAQGLKDEIRATRDKFAGANAGTAEQKEKLLAVFDAELGRISGLLEGMQASAAGGNYEAGFKRGTDAAYRYDYVNAAFNQVK